MKYIIFEHQGLECPVIFPEWMKHNDFANHFGESFKVISAGKIKLTNEIVLRGSVGLGIPKDLKKSEEDFETINRIFDLEI